MVMLLSNRIINLSRSTVVSDSCLTRFVVMNSENKAEVDRQKSNCIKDKKREKKKSMCKRL